MAAGTDSWAGQAVPLTGNSEIISNDATTDVLTITGASAQTGDFIVCRSSAGVEAFVVNSTGAEVRAISMTGAAHVRAFNIAVTEATTASSGYNASFVYEVTNTGAMTPTEYSAGRFNLMLDTGTKTGVFYALKAKVGTNSAATLTGAQVNGLGISLDEIGACGQYRCIWAEMYNTTNTTNSSFLCMKSQGASQQLTMFEHMGTNIPTYLLTTQTTTGGMVVSGAGTYSSADGYIAIRLGSTNVFRIPYFAGTD